MRVSIPSKGEILVFWSFFGVGLCLPLAPDLLSILRSYETPLCRFTPVLIGCMIAFLGLTHELKIPFSLRIFFHFFMVRVMKFEGWVCVGTHQNKKLIRGNRRKFSSWYTRQCFVSVLKDFPLTCKWAVVHHSCMKSLFIHWRTSRWLKI